MGKSLLFGILLSFATAHAAVAQEALPPAGKNENPTTRGEERRRLRIEKSQQTNPPPKSKLERGLFWLETRGLSQTSQFSFHNFYPKFGGLSTGSGFAMGTRYWNPNIKGSRLDLQGSAAASFSGYQLYDLQFGEIQPPRRGFSYHANLRYRDFPQEDFFGVGPDSRESNRTDYRLRDAVVEAALGYQFHRTFKADVQAGVLQFRVDPGTDERYADIDQLFDDSTAPGLADEPDYFRVRTSMTLDYRDRSGSPKSGGMVAFDFARYHQLHGNGLEFNRYKVHASHYFSLGSSARVLALRFYTVMDVTDSKDRVPFYLQETLGGSEMLRGFREFRFRDANLYLLTAEYRWEILQAAELALFYDGGKVFGDRADFNFDRMRSSYGIGLRVKTRDSIVFRIDAAKSSEGGRVYFKFGPAF